MWVGYIRCQSQKKQTQASQTTRSTSSTRLFQLLELLERGTERAQKGDTPGSFEEWGARGEVVRVTIPAAWRSEYKLGRKCLRHRCRCLGSWLRGAAVND